MNTDRRRDSVKARKSISLKTRLAAALCQMLRPNADGKLVPVIDHESAKKMTPEQILSLWHWDHDPIPKHRDGPDVHWNLVPRPIPEHREKTAKVDVPGAAKDKRVMAKQAAFRRKMLAKVGLAEPEPKAEKPKRRWKPKGHVWDWKKRRWVEEKNQHGT